MPGIKAPGTESPDEDLQKPGHHLLLVGEGHATDWIDSVGRVGTRARDHPETWGTTVTSWRRITTRRTVTTGWSITTGRRVPAWWRIASGLRITTSRTVARSRRIAATLCPVSLRLLRARSPGLSVTRLSVWRAVARIPLGNSVLRRLPSLTRRVCRWLPCTSARIRAWWIAAWIA